MNKKQAVTYLAMLIGTLFATSTFGTQEKVIINKSFVNVACSGECQGATLGDGDNEKTNAP